MRLITGAQEVSTHSKDFTRQLLTLLSSASVSQLLQATAHLLGSSSLASLLEDPVRDEPIAKREAPQKARLSGIVGLVILKTCRDHQKML